MATSNELQGKVCIVTGGGSGIGAEIVFRLAEAGAKVAVAGRRTDRLAEVAKRCAAAGHEHAVFEHECDVTDRQAVKALVEATEKNFESPVDVLVNNAGVMFLSPWEAVLEDEWERMVDVNIKGVLNGVGAVLGGMLSRKDGIVVNISSDAGRKVFPTGGVYCATKWAVEAITQSLRAEHADAGLRFLSIQPGATESELASHITHADVKKAIADGAGKSPTLAADDVARAVVFALQQPKNCSINEIMLRPIGQGQ